MALTESSALSMGTIAPDFSLPNVVSGQLVARDDFADAEGLLVAFICNHCPFVKHIQNKFVEVAKELQKQSIEVVAISSNDVKHYPADHPDKMVEIANQFKFSFPYLYDSTQEIARAYNAVCTPEFFLFDKEFRLFYHGQFDDSRPGNSSPVTGSDLQHAAAALKSGAESPVSQKPSIGCSIKWI